jgi:glutamine cyclotransferase
MNANSHQTAAMIARGIALFAVAVLMAGCRQSQIQPKEPILPVLALVPTSVPQIVRILPHDTAAFTQGLVFANKKLYESTGLEGKSTLRVINAATGVVEKKIRVDTVFAEGLAHMGAYYVQLTWKNQYAIVWSAMTLRPVGRYAYDGEGWGLTADAVQRFIMSNGSDTLYWRDTHFALVGRQPVTFRGKPLTKLNELEFAREKIYANVWYNDFVYAIDIASGEVTAAYDCRELIRKAGVTNPDQVLNGIAYDPSTDHFYLTGKNWPVMFEVVLE